MAWSLTRPAGAPRCAAQRTADPGRGVAQPVRGAQAFDEHQQVAVRRGPVDRLGGRRLQVVHDRQCDVAQAFPAARPPARPTAAASVGERLAREDIFVVRLTKVGEDAAIARATGRATRRPR
ncbi:hypothetical protein [Mycolicibacterium frederiksbergense]|uniref:hypothetical protein n=1 Tax=Mycolicibacterium frederiksbergense TaxID=117567 RepID=UPI00143AA5A3|nr:hypothetical protein [Mycolicibacterium frederiksbergense]